MGEEAWPSIPRPGKFYLITAAPGERSVSIDVLEHFGAGPAPVTALHGPQLEARYEPCDDAAYFTLTEACIDGMSPRFDVQAFLSDRMERLGADIAGVHSVLNESLNFYMGMVSHRTNKIVNRLTIISMIFLPLSFIAGVYGMNFRVEPELDWQYSYLVFWVFVVLFISSFLVFVRKKKWI